MTSIFYHVFTDLCICECAACDGSHFFFTQKVVDRNTEILGDADQKILVDAFSALPADVKNQKLLEIVELAAKAVAREQKKEE